MSTITFSFLCTLLLYLWVALTQAQPESWCAPIELPSLPFIITQPTWWNEYYYINAVSNTTADFKVYTGVNTPSHIEFMINQGTCPYFYKNISIYTATMYSYGTANITIDMIAGTTYYIFVHISGSNYTLIGCNGPCAEYCPNDCTNFQGVCDVGRGSCLCNTGWTGRDCAVSSANQTHIHHKEPFGSWTLFYAMVAGLPAFVIIALVFLIASYIAVHRQQQQQQQSQQKYLYLNNNNNHNNHSNRNSKKISAEEEQEALLSPSSLLLSSSHNSPPIRLETAPPLL